MFYLWTCLEQCCIVHDTQRADAALCPVSKAFRSRKHLRFANMNYDLLPLRVLRLCACVCDERQASEVWSNTQEASSFGVSRWRAGRSQVLQAQKEQGTVGLNTTVRYSERINFIREKNIFSALQFLNWKVGLRDRHDVCVCARALYPLNKSFIYTKQCMNITPVEVI
jgi:hypothetical protein